MNGFPNAAAASGRARWVTLGVVGLVAVIGGLFLPQLVSAPAAPAPPAAVRPDRAALSYTPPALPDGPSPQSLMVRLLVGTAVVLGLGVGVLWIGRRWLAPAPPKFAAPGQMTLVETLALGNRCSVHLVAVGARQVLVGVDASGVKSMVALPEQFGETLSELERLDPISDAVRGYTTPPAA